MQEQKIMLIADDVEINRDVLKEMFKDSFTIVEAKDGMECIELVSTYSTAVKVVLLDIHMPRMSGLDVLTYRNTNPVFANIPVIVITVNDEVDSQTEAFRLGATDYITKPFNREIVIHRINNILSSKNRVDEIVKEKELLQVKSELDLMTELYNKVTAERLIAEKLMENNKVNALLIVDIDNFKLVNDHHGHLVGDHTIRIIADLLSGYFRKTDIIGRIGGDEFIVFMSDLPSKELAVKKADSLVNLLRSKPNITVPANVSISIGLAVTQPRPYTYEELFSKSDEALHFAKQSGKGQYVEYGIEDRKDLALDGSNTIFLISSDRNIIGNIHMIVRDFPAIEVFTFDDIDSAAGKYKDHLLMICADITAEEDYGEHLLNAIRGCGKLKDIPLFVICAEGSMAQYQTAVLCGAADIIPAPIDRTFLKRRMSALLSAKESAPD